MNTLPHYYGKRNFYFYSTSYIFQVSPVTHIFKETPYTYALTSQKDNIFTDDFIYAHLLLLHSYIMPISNNYKSIKIYQEDSCITEYYVRNYEWIQKESTCLTDYNIRGNKDSLIFLLNSRTELEKALEIFTSYSITINILQENLICDTWKLDLTRLMLR